MSSLAGMSLKRASNWSASTVSSATSFSARAMSLSRWVVRTSVARSYALSMIALTSSSMVRATSSL
jgi:hypothetical protein